MNSSLITLCGLTSKDGLALYSYALKIQRACHELKIPFDLVTVVMQYDPSLNEEAVRRVIAFNRMMDVQDFYGNYEAAQKQVEQGFKFDKDAFLANLPEVPVHESMQQYINRVTKTLLGRERTQIYKQLVKHYLHTFYTIEPSKFADAMFDFVWDLEGDNENGLLNRYNELMTLYQIYTREKSI